MTILTEGMKTADRSRALRENVELMGLEQRVMDKLNELTSAGNLIRDEIHDNGQVTIHYFVPAKGWIETVTVT